MKTFGVITSTAVIGFALFFMPVTVMLTNDGSAGVNVDQGRYLALNQAHAAFDCAAAQAAMWEAWWIFAATKMIGPGRNLLNSFGGRIAKTMTCWNATVAFTTAPTYFGSGGPYGVTLMAPPLYLNYQVRPGVQTMGNAPGVGVCQICVPAEPWCCIFPSIRQVMLPGMGTSMY